MKQLRLFYKFIFHFLTSSNTRGHGVHSPYIFNFTNYVLNNKEIYYIFPKIEAIRFNLMHDKRTIFINDFGTGNERSREISNIALKSLKSPKFGQLLFRIVNYFKMKDVLELGTSLGLTTSYLASSSRDICCLSLEGCPQTAKIAQENFSKLGLENIKIVVGNINDTLSQVLNEVDKFDLIFFDANHRSESVLNYFNQCLSKINKNSIIVIDDIYWSADMEKAWVKIKEYPVVMSTIDLFHIGIVFFNPDLHKKHYKMRY